MVVGWAALTFYLTWKEFWLNLDLQTLICYHLRFSALAGGINNKKWKTSWCLHTKLELEESKTGFVLMQMCAIFRSRIRSNDDRYVSWIFQELIDELGKPEVSQNYENIFAVVLMSKKLRVRVWVAGHESGYGNWYVNQVMSTDTGSVQLSIWIRVWVRDYEYTTGSETSYGCGFGYIPQHC